VDKNKESFEYTYSAAQQAEIERIKSKYVPKQESKLEQLRKLDASVTRPGMIVGLLLGIIGCLIFGGGMSCCLVWGEHLFVAGIVLGLLGMLLMILAYPIYARITAREKERIAPLILALTEELGA